MTSRKKRQRRSSGRRRGSAASSQTTKLADAGSAPSGDRTRVLYLFLFGLISVALFDAFSIDKHLSADGVHYFVEILDSGTFYRVDWARRFAEFIIQWPLVLAVRAGVTQVPLLSACFALGIYLPYLLSFALSLHAVRRENPALLSLPLLSMVSVNLPAHFILAGEHPPGGTVSSSFSR